MEATSEIAATAGPSVSIRRSFGSGIEGSQVKALVNADVADTGVDDHIGSRIRIDADGSRGGSRTAISRHGDAERKRARVGATEGSILGGTAESTAAAGPAVGVFVDVDRDARAIERCLAVVGVTSTGTEVEGCTQTDGCWQGADADAG